MAILAAAEDCPEPFALPLGNVPETLLAAVAAGEALSLNGWLPPTPQHRLTW